MSRPTLPPISTMSSSCSSFAWRSFASSPDSAFPLAPGGGAPHSFRDAATSSTSPLAPSPTYPTPPNYDSPLPLPLRHHQLTRPCDPITLPPIHTLSLNNSLPTPPPSNPPSTRGLKRARSLSNASQTSQGSFVFPPSGGSASGSDDDVGGTGGKKERKGFADGLVDTAVFTIEAIWNSPLPGVNAAASSDESNLPLRLFIHETLRRSRTSCSTLQAALFYLFRVREKIKALRAAAACQPEASRDPILCGRRTFLSALILASKFLQDRHFSNKAWAKMSGLAAREISANERAFLGILGYELSIAEATWDRWTAFLKTLVDNKGIVSPGGSPPVSPLGGPASSLLTASRSEPELEERRAKVARTGIARSTSDAQFAYSAPAPASSPAPAPVQARPLRRAVASASLLLHPSSATGRRRSPPSPADSHSPAASESSMSSVAEMAPLAPSAVFTWEGVRMAAGAGGSATVNADGPVPWWVAESVGA